LIADIHEGYVYRIRRYFNGKQYYRCCHKEKCPGRLVCHEGRFHALNQHDHDGDMHVVQNYKLVADCRSRAINEDTPVAQIIQEEVDKYEKENFYFFDQNIKKLFFSFSYSELRVFQKFW